MWWHFYVNYHVTIDNKMHLRTEVSSRIKQPWRWVNETFPVLSAVCVSSSRWHASTPITCAFVACNCMLVADKGLRFPVEMKGPKASHFCQYVVSSDLPGRTRALLVPVVTGPTSGMAILAALNCKTHNPLLTSALSSLLAIMIMWILIDYGGLLSLTEYTFILSHMWPARPGRR